MSGSHHDNPYLAHHFDTPRQQLEANKLGIWLFLGQEIMFFSALFVGLMIFRSWYPQMYHTAAHELSVPQGAFNTIVLICSSLTMALAVRWAQMDVPNNNRTVFWLCLATFALAGVFLVVKYFEYSHKIHVGTLPGKFFDPSNPEFPAALKQFDNAKLFFGFYFCLTGLHGIHVLAGMGVIGWIMVRARRNEFNSKNFAAVECVGLYWHLVDLVWIFLFPLLYLVG
ncbi:MAG: cytochrome c oxidase subunit 3 family protein [Deltaproteobacteria bacterium]|nr:cytochrome c oxidase subunit 3 family protein [Deltaproteobacteria bacterium]